MDDELKQTFDKLINSNGIITNPEATINSIIQLMKESPHKALAVLDYYDIHPDIKIAPILRRATQYIIPLDVSSLLIAAIQLRNATFVEYLLDRGANPYVYTNSPNIQYSIHLAARNRDLIIIDALVRHGMDINIKDSTDETAFTIIVDYGSEDEVEELWTKYKPNINLAIFAAARSGNPQLFQRIISYGGDITERRPDRQPILNFAVRGGSTEIVRSIIEGGIKPLYVPPFPSPVTEAVMTDNPELIRLLCGYGADPNVIPDDRVTALEVAVEKSSARCIKALFEMGVEVNTLCGVPTYSSFHRVMRKPVVSYTALLESGVTVTELLILFPDIKYSITRDKGYSELAETMMLKDPETVSRVFQNEGKLNELTIMF